MIAAALALGAAVVLAPPACHLDSIAEPAVAKGVAFLLGHQNKDGSFGSYSGGRNYEIMATVPGSLHAFKMATTALAGMALRVSPIRTEECAAAADRAVKYVIDHRGVGRPNGVEMYHIWALAYGLQLCSEELLRSPAPERAAELKTACADLVRRIAIYQVPDGGWTYYDFKVGAFNPSDSSMTFTTATVLHALHQATLAGIEVDPKRTEKALRSIRRLRKEDGGYAYGTYLQYRPELGINKIKGSLGRSQACNYAIQLYGGKMTREDMTKDLESMVAKQEFLDIARKRPIPHEAWYQNSGYFYFYGTYYAGLVLDLLDPADRERLWPGLRDMVVSKQEEDGSFWDYPLYGFHKGYGTAYAILALCRPDPPAPEPATGK